MAKRQFKRYKRLSALRQRISAVSAAIRQADERVQQEREELWRLYANEQLLESQIIGSPKPMCNSCLRRIYGIPKDGGWWCTNCECWVLLPKKKSGKK